MEFSPSFNPPTLKTSGVFYLLFEIIEWFYITVMPTTESSMLDILVLKLLYPPCLWEFLISLFFTTALEDPKMLYGVLRNSSNFLSPLFFRLPVSLPYTNSINLHFPLEGHLCFQPWIAAFVYQRLTSVTSILYFFLQQPGLVETLSIFPNSPTSSSKQ